MNRYRHIIALVSLLLFPCSSVISQEAVERAPEQEPGLLPDQTGEQNEEADKPKKSVRKEKAADQRVLQDMMTADEFRAAGLEKLSDAELKNLNDWLQGYRATTEKKVAEKVTQEVTQEVTQKVTEKVKATRPKLDTVVSRVDGTFNGLTGSTVIKLEDGSSWKQANPQDRFAPQISDHPSATVNRTMFGWKMQIAGTPAFYVDPVRD